MFKPMSKDAVEKRLNKKLMQKAKEIQAEIDSLARDSRKGGRVRTHGFWHYEPTKEDRQQKIAELEIKMAQLSIRNISGIAYKTKSNYFSSSSGRCGYNPETGDGHSYDWYDLTKVINGQLVLNSHRYSMQTCKHIHSMRALFADLGLKYIEVEAPKGLQNMEYAFDHALMELARAKVRKEFATKRTEAYSIRYWSKELKTLSMLMKKTVTEKHHANALERARHERLQRLEGEKRRREYELERSLQNAIANNNLREIVQLTLRKEKMLKRKAVQDETQAA